MAQLGAAFVALPPPTASGAPQSLVIRLDPLELGRVQIRVDRTRDGAAHVQLAVERPDTLLLLLQDRPRLDQALDLAGVPQAGRTVGFSLGDPQSGTPDGRQTSGQTSGQGSGHGEQSRAQARETEGWDQAPSRNRRAAQAWARAGVDITA